MGADSAGHAFVEHTGEVQLELEADSLAELFVEAARALAEIFTGEVPAVPPSEPSEPVSLAARDLDALLVDWLNELIFRTETRQKIFSEVRVDHVGGGELRGSVRGVRPEVLKTAVKAATFHRLRVEPRDGRVRATVVLDV